MSASNIDPRTPVSSTIITQCQRISVLADGLLRFESSDDGSFEERASTFAQHRALPTPDFKVLVAKDGSRQIVTNRVHVCWDGKPFSASGLSVLLREKNRGWSRIWRYGERDEKLTNLGGTTRTLDNVNGRCELDDGILSQYGFAIIDDSTSMLFDASGWVAPRRPGRTDLYVFAYGTDYRSALQAFHQMSGRVPLVPRWSLGNWWSRYYRYSAQEYLDLMDRFKLEQVPMSVAVLDIDWHLIDVPGGFGTGWTGYTWNEELFPDPPAFLKALHERDLKVTLNLHPADGVRPYEKPYAQMCAALDQNPKDGLPVAFDCTDKRFLDAYFKILHHPLEDEGVDFWWMDWQQGKISRIHGIDPLWVLNHFHYLDSGRRGDRRITFSRYAGPGSHRYPIGFSGDTIITWDSLAFQPEFTATASNIGYGWWSHDIGGHFKGIKDDELYARWVQLGVFSPLLRLHCSESMFNTREPWAFGDEARQVATASLQFRHRLVPYLYTAAVQAALENKHIVEPVYYEYPDTPEAYRYKNQFFFGGQLLVFPIVSPRITSINMARTQGWLPPGRWIDIFTGIVYDGDRVIQLHRSIQLYPVLAKQGAIIPLDVATGNSLKNGCPVPAGLEILLVVGSDGVFDLVEDDGHGATIDDVKLSTTSILWSQARGTLTIGPITNALLSKRSWSIRLLGSSAVPKSIEVDGQLLNLPIQSAGQSVDLGSYPSTTKLVAHFPPNPQLEFSDPKKAIFELLDSFQSPLLEKDALWAAVDSPGSSMLSQTLSRVKAASDNVDIVGVFEELLLSGG